MNKHLNNFLDKVKGLPENTTNKNILREMARQLGSAGGKQSVKSRFSGLSKNEISELMRKVRLTKKENKEFEQMVDGCVKSINSQDL